MSVGQHTESIYDNLTGNWFEKSLTLIEGDCTISTEGVPVWLVSPFKFELGWAIHKLKGGAGRFSDRVS